MLVVDDRSVGNFVAVRVILDLELCFRNGADVSLCICFESSKFQLLGYAFFDNVTAQSLSVSSFSDFSLKFVVDLIPVV